MYATKLCMQRQQQTPINFNVNSDFCPSFFVYVPVILAVITLNDISKQEIGDDAMLHTFSLFIRLPNYTHKKDTETLLSEH